MGVVTCTLTVPAELAGALAVNELSESDTIIAGSVPNATEDALARLVPVIVTREPPASGPAFGNTLVTEVWGTATVVVAITSDGSVQFRVIAVPSTFTTIVLVVDVDTVTGPGVVGAVSALGVAVALSGTPPGGIGVGKVIVGMGKLVD